MELVLDLKKRYTYADYLTWMDNVRRELIEGFIKLMPAPRDIHVEVCYNITGNLWSILKKNNGRCKVRPAPFDVRFPKNGETANDKIYNVVQPDICVVCDPAKLDERGCIGAPDLVVEVISPSTGKRDLNEKYFLYEAAGVREYWVVYPEDKAVTVFLLQDDGKFDDGTTYQLIDGKVQVPVHTLEGLMIDLEEIFEK